MEPIDPPVYKDETDNEFEARIKEFEQQQDRIKEERLAQLQEHTPTVMRIVEKKQQNERLQEQLDQVEKVEKNIETYKTLSVEELYKLEFPAEEWIIDKILPASGITLFVGESGVGKSFVALEVVRALISQDIFLDHFEIKDSASILIIDKENGLRRLQKRMIHMGVPSSNQVHTLVYPEQFTLDNKEFLKSVSDFIKEQNIKVVILDSLIDVIIGSENDSGDTAKVFNTLKSISSTVCWVILHHDSKPMPHQNRSAGQKTRGSSNIIAQVDNQFYIEKTKTLKVINIEQGKSRDNEPVPKFSLEFLSDGIGNMIGFKYLGEVQSELSKLDEATTFVENYLQEYTSKSRQDIIDAGVAEGISSRSTSRALKTLTEKNIIDSAADGRRKIYFLSPEEPEPTN